LNFRPKCRVSSLNYNFIYFITRPDLVLLSISKNGRVSRVSIDNSEHLYPYLHVWAQNFILKGYAALSPVFLAIFNATIHETMGKRRSKVIRSALSSSSASLPLPEMCQCTILPQKVLCFHFKTCCLRSE
jgi:hypothetical protein